MWRVLADMGAPVAFIAPCRGLYDGASFVIGDVIPHVGVHDSYTYVGVGDGYDHVHHRLQLEPKINEIKREAVALLRSELAPWQIIKALMVYVYPKDSVLKRRRLRAHATCRAPTCSRAETLAHVLNHCEGNMDLIRERHDAALEQIGAAIRRTADSRSELKLNQTVPECDGPALRPDIVLRDRARNTVVIADLAITMEDQPTYQASSSSSLQHSRDHKVLKYQPVAAALNHYPPLATSTALFSFNKHQINQRHGTFIDRHTYTARV